MDICTAFPVLSSAGRRRGILYEIYILDQVENYDETEKSRDRHPDHASIADLLDIWSDLWDGQLGLVTCLRVQLSLQHLHCPDRLLSLSQAIMPRASRSVHDNRWRSCDAQRPRS